MTVDELKCILKSSQTKVVNITDTVIIGSQDHLDLCGHKLQSTADPMFKIEGFQWSIRNGEARAFAGITIDLGVSAQGLISGMLLVSVQDDKEVFRCGPNGQCYDTLVQACQLEKGPNMTVPIVNISVPGTHYNANGWNQIRFQTNGTPNVPCVVMECSATDTWLYNNSFTNINGESPNAGLFHCRGCYGTTLQTIGVFDAPVFGPITDDLLWFGKTPDGLQCIYTTIRNYARVGGDLNGFYDVNMFAHYSGTVVTEQLSALGSPLNVNI